MSEIDETPLLENQEVYEIRDNSKRAKILITVFWIIVIIDLFAIVSGYLELELLKSIDRGEAISDDEATMNDLRQMLIGLVQTGLAITSIVVFLNWFRRAYANLHRVGLKYLKHKESMAVWAWFIPIMFLIWPVQIMNEIWAETQEKIKKYDPSYYIKSGGLVIGVWWTLFVISNFVGQFIFRAAFKDETIQDLINGSQAFIIADSMQIPEALLIILIVHNVSKMESKLAQEVEKAGGTVLKF